MVENALAQQEMIYANLMIIMTREVMQNRAEYLSEKDYLDMDLIDAAFDTFDFETLYECFKLFDDIVAKSGSSSPIIAVTRGEMVKAKKRAKRIIKLYNCHLKDEDDDDADESDFASE